MARTKRDLKTEPDNEVKPELVIKIKTEPKDESESTSVSEYFNWEEEISIPPSSSPDSAITIALASPEINLIEDSIVREDEEAKEVNKNFYKEIVMRKIKMAHRKYIKNLRELRRVTNSIAILRRRLRKGSMKVFWNLNERSDFLLWQIGHYEKEVEKYWKEYDRI